MKRKLAAGVCSLLAVLCFSLPCLAAEDTGHSHAEKTQVSEQVSTATNADPAGANTHFYLYIQNPVNGSIPKTGDDGVDTTTLIGLAILTGTGSLICGAYADRKP